MTNEADKPSVEGLMELVADLASRVKWGKPTSMNYVEIRTYVERLASEAAPAALIERTAQLIAHRACCGSEHDPAQGKLHGLCIVCGVPWPCDYAGKPPVATPKEPS